MQRLANFLARFSLALLLVLSPALPAFAQVGESLNTPVDVSAVSVTNSATKLLSGVAIATQANYAGFWLNPTNGEIAVGGPSVATTTGVLVASGEKIWIPWKRGQGWYAIRTGGSNVDVRVVPVKP